MFEEIMALASKPTPWLQGLRHGLLPLSLKRDWRTPRGRAIGMLAGFGSGLAGGMAEGYAKQAEVEKILAAAGQGKEGIAPISLVPPSFSAQNAGVLRPPTWPEGMIDAADLTSQTMATPPSVELIHRKADTALSPERATRLELIRRIAGDPRATHGQLTTAMNALVREYNSVETRGEETPEIIREIRNRLAKASRPIDRRAPAAFLPMWPRP